MTLEKLTQILTGKRKSVTEEPVTPKRIYDQIHRGEKFEESVDQYKPTTEDVKEKED